jgi:glycosyltransferase involved in cell wall biosynthesis
MLPTQISLHSLPPSGSSSPLKIVITELLNISRFSSLMGQRSIVDTVLESEISDHRIRLYHPLLKYNSVKETLRALEPFIAPNTVLDVGNIFLRMIDTDCKAQKEMAEIIHLLLECFPDEIPTLTDALLRHSLRAGYHFVHEERTREEGGTIVMDWDSILSSGIFPTNHDPAAGSTLIACVDCPQTKHTQRVRSLDSLVTQLNPSLQQQYTSHASFPYLVSLKIAIDSHHFGGTSSSSFSHLVVSERLYRNSDSQSHNLCLDSLPSPIPFTSQGDHSSFGRQSPDVTCSHLSSVESTRQLSALQDIIRGIPKLFDTIGLSLTPFNAMMYLLSFEPPTHVLPLVFAYLEVPLGEYSKLFLKIETLYSVPYQREVIRSGLLKALTAAGISHHSSSGDTSPPLHILMVIHDSCMQGAPLMAFYVAKMFQEKLGFLVDFFVDEKMRGSLEDLLSAQGMRIMAGSNFSSINTAEYDLLYLNTIVSWYDTGARARSDLSPSLSLARLYSEKCILYVHESLRDEIYRAFPRSPEVMKAAKGLIFVTPRSMSVYDDVLLKRKELKAAAGQEFHSYVIGNSLAASVTLNAQLRSERQKYREHLGLLPSDLLFVTSGDVYANRNQHLFVEAANNLLDNLQKRQQNSASVSVPKVYFLVIGVVAPYSKYTKSFLFRVKSSRYTSHFIIEKKKPHEKSLAYMAAGDVYVSLARKESFGLALLEAMSMGLPVIVAKLDGVPDVIYKEALDVDLQSAKSVTEAMETMLSLTTRQEHSALSQARSLFFQQQFFFLRHVDTLTRVLGKADTDSRREQGRAKG